MFPTHFLGLPFFRRAMLAVVTIATMHSVDAQQHAESWSSSSTDAREISAEKGRAMLDQYCVACHNARVKTAGLMLDRADLAHVPDQAEIWERVVRKLRAGAMPPLGMPRPDRVTADAFAAWLEMTLDKAATGDPGPGGMRRLNRTEYATAIRDLLHLDVDVASLLPADDANHGFDNMSDALRVSPALLEGYLSAARKISRLAVGDPEINPAFTTYRVKADLGQDHPVEGLPLGTRGGMLVEHTFPLDAEYVFQPRLAVNTSAKVRGLDFEHEVVITVDGKTVHRAAVGGGKDEDAAAVSPPASEAEIQSRMAARVWVNAGPHSIGVTFARKTSALPDGILQPFLRSNFDTQEQRGVPYLESIGIGGPFQANGAGDTPSRRTIFICHPAASRDDPACAKKILADLTRRAYRRPITDSDVEYPLRFYRAGRSAAGLKDRFDGGIEDALRFILTSPEFLFRTETDPAPGKIGPYRSVTDVDLASRLSFFLWSSLPDRELLDVASRGMLRKPGVLETQVRRMLADSRSAALTTNFAGQWLYLRNLRGTDRDLAVFPNFDDNLRQAFQRETELFFGSIVREDRSALDLLRADYTFVNERLAKHYGIPNVHGSEFRRVALPSDRRRGLLGQGSVLAVTSYATRTSPVLRGKWLLENILGTPVPPPPPGVPALEENHAGLHPRSVRERMEEHRKNPACAVCHNIMDPLGFSLENFDAIGAWRDRSESGAPIDASGMLVDGTRIDGPVSLRNALLSRPETFMQTLTEKLLTYAVGRGVEYYDMPAVRAIARKSAHDDNRFSSLVLGIVQSAPFQMKRGEPPETAPGGKETARTQAHEANEPKEMRKQNR